MDELPSRRGLWPRLQEMLFPNLKHKKLVGVAFSFLRFHWKKYSEVKIYAHDTPQIDWYYRSIQALRENYDATDDSQIRQSIKEVNRALSAVRELTRSIR